MAAVSCEKLLLGGDAVVAVAHGVGLGDVRVGDAVVVRADHVQAREDHPAVRPARVLGMAHAVDLALVAQAQLALPEGIGGAEEGVGDVVEALEGVVAAVAAPVAIRPLVVAGHVDRGRFERVQAGGGLGVDAVVATRAAVLGVPVEHGEGERLAVHVGDEVGHEGRALLLRVGQVAPQADVEGAGAAVAVGRGAAGSVVVGKGEPGGVPALVPTEREGPACEAAGSEPRPGAR